MNANEIIAAAIALAIGITASVALYLVSVQADREQQQLQFRLLAEARFGAIEQQLRNAELAVASTASLFESSARVSAAEFAAFARTMHRRNPPMESLSWAPQIATEQQQAFEQTAREQLPEFSIRTFLRAETGALKPDTLYPVLFSYPSHDYLLTPGLDVASIPELRDAIAGSINEGSLQASSALHVAQEIEASGGIVLVHPVYRGPIRTRPERQASATGVILASLRLKSLLDATLYSLKQSDAGLNTIIFDLTAEKRTVLYQSAPIDRDHSSGLPDHEHILKVGDRQWSVVTSIDANSVLLHASARAMTLLVIGLLATLFAIAYLVSSSGQARQVRKLVDQKTRDLLRTQRISDAILNTSNNTTMLLDDELLITRTNQAARGLFGLSEEELTGMQVEQLIPGLGKRIAEPGGFEIRGLGAGGFPLDLRAWISENQIDNEYFRVLVLHDITEQRVVESSVRDQRNLMQAILDTMSETLVLVDYRRRPQIINRAARQLFGPKFQLPEPSDLPNEQGFLDSISGIPLSTWELPLNRALAGEHVAFREVTLRNELHPAGIRLEITAAPILRGSHTAAMMVATDVTERTLAQARLMDFARKLQASNQELEQFSRAASHDLQEPLRKIERFGSLLLEINEHTLDQQSADFLNRMISAASRMSGMIDALLTLARINSRKSSYARCNLNRIATSALDTLQVRIEETGADLEVDMLPEIDADPVQMEQLFTNLLSNGLKYVQPDATPHLHLYAMQPDEPGQCILVFQDHGIGFPGEKADKLFEVFSRLVRRDQYAGNGVGLSICKRIVERHGGKIWAESAVGEGASFYVQLPVHQLATEDEAGR